jgi:hypothetical protein
MRLVYIDESGDHALAPVNPEYPVFVMVACVFEVADYLGEFVPRMTGLKIRHWGHDGIVLHERDLRRPGGENAWIANPRRREGLMADIGGLVSSAKCTMHAVAWDKREGAVAPGFEDVYARCLGRLIDEIVGRQNREASSAQGWVIESRGRREDDEVRRSLLGRGGQERMGLNFVPKARNVSGLQLADLCARPIGRKVMAPMVPNRAYETLRPLLRPPLRTTRVVDGRIELL